jgi:hypothetical protein
LSVQQSESISVSEAKQTASESTKIEQASSSSSSSKVEEAVTVSTSESTLSQAQLQHIQTSAHLASSVNAVANSVASIQKANQQDDFENLNRAVQILGKAKQLDDIKRYDEALKLYRQGIDMLLEELIIRPGTEQSRTYLRNKCNDFMNRIDQLKLLIQIENTNKELASKQEEIKAKGL